MKFHKHLRKRRESKGISLRSLAKQIGVSPTYLSNVERGLNVSPMTEERLVRIADAFNQDRDTWICKGGRVPSDIVEIIQSNPRYICWALRVKRSAWPTVQSI